MRGIVSIKIALHYITHRLTCSTLGVVYSALSKGLSIRVIGLVLFLLLSLLLSLSLIMHLLICDDIIYLLNDSLAAEFFLVFKGTKYSDHNENDQY